MPFRIEPIPCLSDNYAYLVRTEDSELCAVIDPSEAAPVVSALTTRGWKPQFILNTHHHHDHTGGNLALKSLFGAQVVGPGKDAARIAGLDIGVDESTSWRFGLHTVKILEIPAHTRGHIAFVFDDCVFTGDTLFAMGCGRLFEGTPQTMWDSLGKLMQLPDATQIYCGHEYTLSNGRFALTLEPGNADLQTRMLAVEAVRKKGVPTIPSNISLEKKTNPFLRAASLEIRRTLGMEDASDVEVFAEMRRRKDAF